MSLYLKHKGKTLSTGIKEAPDTNKIYGRQNKGWSEIVIPEVNIEYPPSDDKLYGIKNEEWKEVVIPEIEISSDDFVPSVVKTLTDDIDEESGLPTGEQSLQPKSTVSHTEDEGLKYKSNISNNNIIIREKLDKSDLEIIVNGQQFENWLSGKLVSSAVGNAIMKHASDNKLYAQVSSVANRQRFNTSGTFTVPTSGTIVITLSGGGGGGGSGSPGGGGGSSYLITSSYTHTNGSKGGDGHLGTPVTGGTGGTTTVKIGSTTIASAVGGTGGTGSTIVGKGGQPGYGEVNSSTYTGEKGASIGDPGVDGNNGATGSGLIADVAGGAGGWAGGGGTGGAYSAGTVSAGNSGSTWVSARGGNGGNGGKGGTGGKGGKQRIIYNVTAGQTLTITIGAGGAGGINSNQFGGNTSSPQTTFNGIPLHGSKGTTGGAGSTGSFGYVELEW